MTTAGISPMLFLIIRRDLAATPPPAVVNVPASLTWVVAEASDEPDPFDAIVQED